MTDKEFIDTFNRFLNRFNWEIKIYEKTCIVQTRNTSALLAVFKDIDEMLYGRECEEIRNYKEKMSLFDLIDSWIRMYSNDDGNDSSFNSILYNINIIPNNIEQLLLVRGSSKEEILLKLQMMGY